MWVDREIAPIVRWLLDETHRRGYKANAGECWGYCNRAIRGSTAPSNHSWGLAVDINAPSNPMCLAGTTDMPAWMPKLWRAWGFGWGGDYPRRKDAMHYEFTGSPADARALVAKLGDAPVLPARMGPEEKVKFMHDPPLVLEPIVASMAWKGGGCLLAASGAVYAFGGAPYLGGANGQAFFKGRRAAQIENRTDRDGYVLIATSGERYAFPL